MEQKLIQNGRALALKLFIESYLLTKDEEKAKAMFSNKKTTGDIALSGEDTYFLHLWLTDEFKALGLDLNKIIENKGEVADGKRLSKFEIDELVRRADMLLLQISSLKGYIDANKEF